ncbi:MAG TPA: branched-chain amino acid ABC transporter permease [Burkholderiaceae bacterium]|nr:branched-chain amino acid ABC transporter permease [Burkholderiaceae bacterium]
MSDVSRHTIVAVVVLALLALAGLTVGTYTIYLLNLAMIAVIAAIGLNLLTGNTGQISLSHSSFMAIGAYVSALLTARYGVPFWVAIPTAATVAAVIGGCLGLPASRLQGIYLALATLGFLQIVQIVIEEFADITGGVRGMSVPKPSWLGGAPLTEYGAFLVVSVACVFAVWSATNILASAYGREMNAVRLSPHAAQALGVAVARVKLGAFALSAAYAGVAGGLLAMVVGFIDPIEFGVSAALRQITYIVVGGMGSVAGSVIGAVVLSGLPEVLRPVREYSDVIYTLILLAFLLFMPHGLVTVWYALRRRLQRTLTPARQ